MEIKRVDGESYVKFIKRIISLVEQKTINYNEMGDALLGEDNVYSSDNLRKSFYVLKKLSEKIEDDYVVTDFEMDNILTQKKHEVIKETIKMRDERNELNKKLREQSRKESLVELFKDIINGSDCEGLSYTPNVISSSDNDLVVHLTDIHTGIEIDNFANQFNEFILKDRLARYIDKILEIQKRHNSKDCYLIVSEVLSGIIHENLRIENNMNVIQQFKVASTYICDFIKELGSVFENVHVHTVIGNHSRITADKKKSVIGENLDFLIPYYGRSKLQNFTNIIFYDNDIEETISCFHVRDNFIVASHGDRDCANRVVQNMSMMLKQQPSIVYLGHRHTNGYSTVYDTKVVESGCMSGTDTFAIGYRMRNKAEQTVSVVNNEGLECVYDITLQ